MVPSGLREADFFLFSKELGDLRQRDLTSDIYHVLTISVASLGQLPYAAELALGCGSDRCPLLLPEAAVAGGTRCQACGEVETHQIKALSKRPRQW